MAAGGGRHFKEPGQVGAPYGAGAPASGSVPRAGVPQARVSRPVGAGAPQAAAPRPGGVGASQPGSHAPRTSGVGASMPSTDLGGQGGYRAAAGHMGGAARRPVGGASGVQAPGSPVARPSVVPGAPGAQVPQSARPGLTTQAPQSVRPGGTARTSQFARPAAGKSAPSSAYPGGRQGAAAVPPASGSGYGARAAAPAPVTRTYNGQGSSPYARPSRGGSGSRGGRGTNGSSPEGPRRRNVLSWILIAIGVALMLFAAFLFIRAQLGYKQAQDFYNGIAEQVVSDTEGDGAPVIDFEALQAQGKDVVGWIFIPNTQVNYPVVKGSTNEQYLRHFIDGSYNENGTIFMDMDGTAPGMVDQQTTVYGHHMNDGSMFKVIDDTLSQDAFDAIERVYYITPETTYVLKPLFTAQVQDDYLDARRTNFDSDKAFTQYLQAMLGQAKASAPDAGELVEQTDQVMTLVTCAGDIIPRTTRAAMVCSVEETMPTAKPGDAQQGDEAAAGASADAADAPADDAATNAE